MDKKTTLDRFWEKVEIGGSDQCWLWTGSKRNKGYGAFIYEKNGQVVQGRAHRYSYELHVGEIPPGLFVLHTCDNPACVNPFHLFLGTNQDNVDDMMKKGRHKSAGSKTPLSKCKYKHGIEHHQAKLNPDLVRQLRNDRAAGMSYSKLAKKYHLALGSTYRIVNRKVWKDVE
jgi:hypothetical protein